MKSFKQIIIVRQDLQLSKGKMSAQVAHASVDALLKSDKDDVTKWHTQGMKKSVLKVKDLEGNSFSDLTLDYLISAGRVRVSNFLIYPNPFTIGLSDVPLRLGFNLTRAATVKLYVFNYQGRLVFESTQDLTTVGYQTLMFDGFSGFLKSGMYICRLVATDADGYRSTATARMAVY